MTLFDYLSSGGQLLRVSVCITPPSMQNVTTSSFKNIKDENKLNPARMLSGIVPPFSDLFFDPSVTWADLEQYLEMIKRNEAAKRAGEMGIEYDMSNITTSKPIKYHSTAGNDKAVPQGTNIETTVKDAEGDVSLSGIEQRHMLMQRLSRAPQESFLEIFIEFSSNTVWYRFRNIPEIFFVIETICQRIF